MQRIRVCDRQGDYEHLSKSKISMKMSSKVISINILYFDLAHGEDYVYHGKTQTFHGIITTTAAEITNNRRSSASNTPYLKLYRNTILI